MVLVDSGDPNFPNNRDVSPSARVTDLINSLPWLKFLKLDLSSQNSRLLVI
jgi:hypothetical protein